ncbi:MAG: hypothetical protein HPY65_17915 [Syntrophaceae bacterium]|nr:hypothetical protein [Syntrophaceae bacterium]
MNIVVAMKQVPDLKQIRIRNREPVLEDVPLTFGDIGLPAVVGMLADINEPSIPSVTRILKAGRKPKTLYGRDAFSGEAVAPSPVRTLGNLAPEQDRKRIVVKDVPELIAALKAEGRIGR